MPRRFQFSLKWLLVDTGLLCLSLGSISWAHSMPGWHSRDDLAAIVISGILAAAAAILLGCHFLRSWILFVTFVAAIPFASYICTMLLNR